MRRQLAGPPPTGSEPCPDSRAGSLRVPQGPASQPRQAPALTWVTPSARPSHGSHRKACFLQELLLFNAQAPRLTAQPASLKSGRRCNPHAKMQCLRKRAHATPRPTPGTPPPSRQRSRGRCRPRLPEGPGRGSPRPRPTAPTGHLGAPGSQARGLPGSPAPPCPVGCFWLGPEKGHCHLCPPGTLEADETHQGDRQGHGAARRKRRPVRPGLGSPLLIGETGHEVP